MLTDPFIVLVEDNPNDEELTLRALRRGNVANRVVVVRDGAAALDYLFGRGDHARRDPREVPHVVLLDLNLPKLSGIDVLRALRTHDITRFLPVVILTSSKESGDLSEAYRAGANSYIVKPVDFTQFAEAVRQVGLYWLMLSEPPPRPRTP